MSVVAIHFDGKTPLIDITRLLRNSGFVLRLARSGEILATQQNAGGFPPVAANNGEQLRGHDD